MQDDPRPHVVVNDDDAGTGRQRGARGFMSAQKFRSENVSAQRSGGFPRAAHEAILSGRESTPIFNPRRVHEEFPDRWKAYIRVNYRNLSHVQQVFGVSERTARKWWKGETGANGGHVAIAVNEHPVAAPRMLFAAE